MTTAAVSYRASFKGMWHNSLPQGILEHPAFQQLTCGERWTLQIIADHCTPEDGGHLSGAWGGKSLVHSVGCSVRTFWRRIKTLEKSGLLVVLSRGGVLNGKNYGNEYAIPVTVGALDDRKCRREEFRMVKSPDGSGRIQKVILVPGTQGILFKDNPGSPTPQNQESFPQPTSQPAAHANHDESIPIESGPGEPQEKEMDSRRNIQFKKRARLRPGDVTLPDLQEDARLSKLCDRLIEMRLIHDSERGRFMVFCSAENALRFGKDPVRMFASMVNAGFPKEKWKFISQADEQSAQERIKRHFFGQHKRNREPEYNPWD